MAIPTLFCKPYTACTLAVYQLAAGALRFRSLDLKQDIAVIHQWVNRDYALPYWQLEGPLSYVKGVYQSILENPNGHSFIGLLNNERVCLVDVYQVLADELKAHVAARETDCGLHLLMAPVEQPVPGLTRQVLAAFLQYFFSFPQADRLYAEPDVRNYKSIRLLQAMRFSYQKDITLSYKEAHLYVLERRVFEEGEGIKDVQGKEIGGENGVDRNPPAAAPTYCTPPFGKGASNPPAGARCHHTSPFIKGG